MKVAILLTAVLAQTALDIVLNSAEHKTLATLAGSLPAITDVLKSSGPLTVFAPTDDAFHKLDVETLKAVQQDGNLLANVLKYHVIPGVAFDPKTAAPKSFPQTALSKPMGVTVGGGAVSLSFGLSTSKVTASVPASNGVVHVVDTVLVPPPSASKLASQGNLTALVAALQKADLVNSVDSAKDVTIFAPTNEAFTKLTAFATESKLDVTTEVLKQILQLHVIPSVATSVDIISKQPLKVNALSGKLVSVTVADGKVLVKGEGNKDPSVVVTADILFENGIVHVIDSVLLPNDFTAIPQVTSSTAKLSVIGAIGVALIAQIF